MSRHKLARDRSPGNRGSARQTESPPGRGATAVTRDASRGRGRGVPGGPVAGHGQCPGPRAKSGERGRQGTGRVRLRLGRLPGCWICTSAGRRATADPARPTTVMQSWEWCGCEGRGGGGMPVTAGIWDKTRQDKPRPPGAGRGAPSPGPARCRRPWGQAGDQGGGALGSLGPPKSPLLLPPPATLDQASSRGALVWCGVVWWGGAAAAGTKSSNKTARHREFTGDHSTHYYSCQHTFDCPVLMGRGIFVCV